MILMKITKNNGKPELRIWKGTCKHCGSTAEAEQREMTSIVYDSREKGEFSWEKCPVCKTGPFMGMIFYPANASAMAPPPQRLPSTKDVPGG
jgi:hypothetical protein